MANDFLLWQLADSAFPTGGFSHSWGLESAWQHGEVPDAEALGRFVRATVLQTGHAMLPVVWAAHREPDRYAEFDRRHEAFLTNSVANRASRTQGRTLLASARRIWPDLAFDTGAGGDGCAHVAPVTGLVLRTLGVPIATTGRLVLFVAVRGVLSSAVRLGIAGSYEAQRLQHECAPLIERVLGECAALDVEDLAATSPLLDVLQGAHDRLYSRLFQS